MTKEKFEELLQSVEEQIKNIDKSKDTSGNKELFASENIVKDYKTALENYASSIKHNIELQNDNNKLKKEIDEKNKAIETINNIQKEKYFNRVLNEGRIKNDQVPLYKEMYDSLGSEKAMQIIDNLPVVNPELAKDVIPSGGSAQYSHNGKTFKNKQDYDDFKAMLVVYGENTAYDLLGYKIADGGKN